MCFSYRMLLQAILLAGFLGAPLVLEAASDKKDDIITYLIPVNNDVVSSGRCTMFYLDKTIVATIVYEKRSKKENLGLIHRLWTHKDFRGKGIGSYMLTTKIEQLKEEGCDTIQLEASPLELDETDLISYLKERRKLILFYNKHGFEITDKAKAIMRKKLTQRNA